MADKRWCGHFSLFDHLVRTADQGVRDGDAERGFSYVGVSITGATQATDTTLYSSGSSTVMIWDLQCKPTKPLF